MIFDLSRCNDFPDPRLANEDGFYAVGGDVTPERLIEGYPMGIFVFCIQTRAGYLVGASGEIRHFP